MKKFFLRMVAGSLCVVALMTSCNQEAKVASLKTQADSLSYSYGVMMAKSLEKEEGLNPDMVAAGIREALMEQSQLTDEQADEAMTYPKKKVGMDFLAENKKKEGVKVTESGLQYKVVTEGAGKSPEASSTVKVHYTGTLIDGNKFDSSVDRGEPISFPLNGVIPGWTEGLQLMKEGGKYIFYIPYNLAYGERGYPPVIPAFATLIFEVELLEVES